jgi:hypothetical protein
LIIHQKTLAVTIGHRTWKTGLPVRSAILKPCAGWLVVGWVTTSEYRLLIVFAVFASPADFGISKGSENPQKQWN